MTKRTKQKPGTEIARDEARQGGGPRFAGGEWDLADENPDALEERRQGTSDAANPDIERGGTRAGTGKRGAPHKTKARANKYAREKK